jgi:hypothetical protein
VRRLVSPRITLVLLAAALPPLALPATAVAKGEQTVKVCGASACMSTDDPGVVGPLHSTFAPTAAPAPAPFFVVRFEQRAARRQREVWSYVYVPSARAMPSDAFGEGPIRWQDASLISANLPDLTRLDPYPAATAWRSPRNGHHDVAWEPLPTAAADANPASLACGPTALGQSQTPWTLVGAVAALSLIAGLVLGAVPSSVAPSEWVPAKRAKL